MPVLRRLTAIIAACTLLGPLLPLPLEARTKKGDKLLAQGRIDEVKQQWDAALKCFEQALAEDPGDWNYRMATDKARFQASQAHITAGLKVRAQGQLGDALAEFQQAYVIDPGSAMATQEIHATEDMIERERRHVENTGKEEPPAERALTPLELYKRKEKEKLDRLLGVPELKPLNPTPINLKMNNKTRFLFETVSKMAGINALWDSEYQPPQRDGFNVDLQDLTIEQALDYLAVLTKSYWKPLSPNTIFITNDNANKRRDYEEQVTKVFYLQNTNTTQELQEIVNAIRTIADVNKVFPFNGQNAIIARGEADRIELAEKIVSDLDKPHAEVLVDILVIEVNSQFSRQITAAIASTGLNVPFTFTPRASITTGAPTSGTDASGATTTTTSNTIGLNSLSHISSADYSTTLPSALLQAAMNDAKSTILQAPEIRTVDNTKATVKIGSRQPVASGSYQPGVSGVGVSPLVSTQFTFLDVGVNVELTTHVHDDDDVTMHIKLDISTVSGYVTIGGISEPIIGQRAVEHEIRMRAGEVGLLGGLINTEDDKNVTGIPGLSSIPFLGTLFKGNSTTHNRDEIMIAIIPHLVRRPDITPSNLREVETGPAQFVKLNRAPAPIDGATAVTPLPAEVAPPPANAAIVPVPMPAAAQPAAPMAPAMPPPGMLPNAPPGLMPPATAPPGAAPPPTGGVPAMPAAAPPAGKAEVHFSPARVDTNLGSVVKVQVMMDNASDVLRAPLEVQFDSKVLKLNDVEQGDLLPAGPGTSFTKNIQNDAGRASIVLSRQPGAQGASASSATLVTLVFQTAARGITTVSLPNLSVRNSQGQQIASGSPLLTIDVR